MMTLRRAIVVVPRLVAPEASSTHGEKREDASMLRQVDIVVPLLEQRAEFEEGAHPRDAHGKFMAALGSAVKAHNEYVEHQERLKAAAPDHPDRAKLEAAATSAGNRMSGARTRLQKALEAHPDQEAAKGHVKAAVAGLKQPPRGAGLIGAMKAMHGPDAKAPAVIAPKVEAPAPAKAPEPASTPVAAPPPPPAPVVPPVVQAPAVAAPVPLPAPTPPAERPPASESVRQHTDEALMKMARDAAVLHAAGYYSFQADPVNPLLGLNVSDRLAILDQAVRVRQDPEFKKIPSDFPPYGFPKGLSADQVRAEIAKAIANPKAEYKWNKATNDANISTPDALAGLTLEQQREMADKLPEFLNRQTVVKGFDLWSVGGRSFRSADWPVATIERMSDNLANAKPETSAAGTARMLGMYSTNYELARAEMFGGWAMIGIAWEAHVARDVSVRLWGEGKTFWTKPVDESRGEVQKPLLYSDRMLPHIQRLKADTEAFYKAKFATKKNPDPDLSKIEVDVTRGLGGNKSNYMPAGAESWTTDRFTAARFGKQMMPRFGQDKGTYTVLSTKTTYADVLWSYQSAAGQPGWPAEKELKGKKELVLIGGRVGNVKAEVHK